MGRKVLVALQLLVTLGLLAAVLGPGHAEAKRKPKPPPPRGIHKIEHVIVIMQENRSFDHYFGTFPGADGIPPNVCAPDPAHGGCVRPSTIRTTSTRAARTDRRTRSPTSTADGWTDSWPRPSEGGGGGASSIRTTRRAPAGSRAPT